MSDTPNTPVPTEELVSYFVDRLSGRVGRTMLMKLLYLADLESRRYLGKPISSMNYQLHHYGPFDQELYRALNTLRDAGEITEEPIEFPAGVGYRYASLRQGRTHNFSRAEEAILGYVFKTYAEYDLQSVLDVVYSSKPMKRLEGVEGDTRLPMECVDNEMQIALGGIDLERALAAEENRKQGKSVPWQVLRSELLDRGRRTGS
jgi:uncharacterized phage-associated protein